MGWSTWKPTLVRASMFSQTCHVSPALIFPWACTAGQRPWQAVSQLQVRADYSPSATNSARLLSPVQGHQKLQPESTADCHGLANHPESTFIQRASLPANIICSVHVCAEHDAAWWRHVSCAWFFLATRPEVYYESNTHHARRSNVGLSAVR